jgi:hypothetical protein
MKKTGKMVAAGRTSSMPCKPEVNLVIDLKNPYL